jgi:hypothetical protein
MKHTPSDPEIIVWTEQLHEFPCFIVCQRHGYSVDQLLLPLDGWQIDIARRRKRP